MHPEAVVLATFLQFMLHFGGCQCHLTELRIIVASIRMWGMPMEVPIFLDTGSFLRCQRADLSQISKALHPLLTACFKSRQAVWTLEVDLFKNFARTPAERTCSRAWKFRPRGLFIGPETNLFQPCMGDHLSVPEKYLFHCPNLPWPYALRQGIKVRRWLRDQKRFCLSKEIKALDNPRILETVEGLCLHALSNVSVMCQQYHHYHNMRNPYRDLCLRSVPHREDAIVTCDMVAAYLAAEDLLPRVLQAIVVAYARETASTVTTFGSFLHTGAPTTIIGMDNYALYTQTRARLDEPTTLIWPHFHCMAPSLPPGYKGSLVMPCQALTFRTKAPTRGSLRPQTASCVCVARRIEGPDISVVYEMNPNNMLYIQTFKHGDVSPCSSRILKTSNDLVCVTGDGKNHLVLWYESPFDAPRLTLLDLSKLSKLVTEVSEHEHDIPHDIPIDRGTFYGPVVAIAMLSDVILLLRSAMVMESIPIQENKAQKTQAWNLQPAIGMDLSVVPAAACEVESVWPLPCENSAWFVIRVNHAEDPTPMAIFKFSYVVEE